MNVMVHLLFAYHVRKIIRKDTGIKLNLLGYMVGNILPDIRARFNSQPHYIDHSLNFVINSGRKIMNNEEGLTSSSYRFSKNMGIINHYLSDYFCYPHQSSYSEGFRRHMTYEFVMLIRYRKGLKRYRNHFGHGSRELHPEGFREWIINRNKLYKGQTICCINDVSHAIHAGSVVGTNLVLYSKYRLGNDNCHFKQRPEDNACLP